MNTRTALHSILKPSLQSNSGTSIVPSYPIYGSILCFVLGMFVLPLDAVISREVYYRFDGTPSILRTFLNRSEPFGHGIGISWMILTISVLDPAHRKACFSLFTTAVCAGGMANFGKLIVSRTRPRDFDFQTCPNFAGFQDGFPALSERASELSFPSAHTATAVAVAIFLTAMYPRGRWLFGALAMVVGLQRLHGGAHFLSDILIGAAWGLLVGDVCVRLARKYGYLSSF